MKENILIRGVNWVGDAVMSMPAIRAIRKAYPGARISLLVKPWVAPLFDKSPDIDDVVLYGEQFEGLAGRLRLAWALRRKSFDRAILLQNAFD
ncbi:MAG: lipopolysaccharide heptosyltransferase II, partial [Nitrospirota bacterium]